ncbi:thioesterase domain-containing protein [uncultured Aquimarina sp.]|uniref:thioesterase II family protein n=1 Tax=uncultured Aquimarina sp. TaxID=575652 RepID=UPI0026116318|nr:thioesterase domain-containing protein [uncultured Aquimarina sp.]
MISKKEKHKIVAFPFAGGNEFSFQSIEKFIPSQFEWITLELPGRGARFAEDLLYTTEDAVDDLFSQLEPLILEGSYMLYGHSMGSLLVYELSKRLVKSNMPLPFCIYVTGRGGPSKSEKEKLADLPFDLFWKKVSEMGGLPKQFLENNDLLKLYYPILKSDFKMIESYNYQKLESPLPIPIYVCMGTEEIGENRDKVSIAQVRDWDNESKFSVIPEFLKGDHFFILEHPEVIAKKICNVFKNRFKKEVSNNY